jgi:NADH-quinone oxidoreductase subunit D
MPGAAVGLEEQLLDPAVQVSPDRLRQVCAFLRDDPETRLDYLRLLTGTDRKDAIEVAYHLYSYTHRHGITLKVRLDRDRPEIASVADLWPVANWHERETYDLVGVVFKDHPNLARLMMPLDWEGHPLRKDYVRPERYHGIPTNRQAALDEGRVAVVPAMHTVKAESIDGFMRVNMGPHHPATHGVINFLLETDGEIMRKATPDVGYLHRGLEKLAEGIPYFGTMPYTDRIDYLGAMFTNHGWALAVERLAGIEVPRRAEYLRVIASELNRIASHLIATGALAMDMGAYTPFIHWIRERETINDIMEQICGARLTYNYMRFGGVSRDLDSETIEKISNWLDHFEPMMLEFDRLISGNEIFIHRLCDVAVISGPEAVAYGLVGPNLRASGVNWDVRKDEAYSVYPEFDFQAIVGQGWKGKLGDAFDRFQCRLLEMRESVKILRQALAGLPEGEARLAKVPKVVKPAANEVYTRVEGPRGECGFYVISDGTDKPYRARYRTGSFTAMTIIEHLSPGLMIADLVALIGSLDVIAPEIDR